jgi:hypothetical protein
MKCLAPPHPKTRITKQNKMTDNLNLIKKKTTIVVLFIALF